MDNRGQQTVQLDLNTPGPYKIVAATSFGVFLSALDASIVNVSLVTMTMSLGVEMAEIQWVVLAYLLIMTSFMPLMGKFGDRYGKTKVFQAGMLTFITGSLFCALSPTLQFLIISRIFQAFGASMMSANGLALVTYYTTPLNRGRAIGLNSVVLAGALALGPVLGGILSQFFGWQSIFLINLPIGIVGFLVVWAAIPETERVHETKFDTVGAMLFLVFLFTLIFMVSVAGSIALFPDFIILLGIAVVSFIAFIFREKGFIAPIIPTRVLADRRISVSIVSALFSFMALVPVTFLFPFYLQDARSFTQVATGLVLVAHPLVISVVGPVSGFVSERVKARTQTVAGLIIQLIGLFFFGMAVANVQTMQSPDTIPWMSLVFPVVGILTLGFGLSFFSVANGNLIMTSAPREYMGVVSALANIARTTGFSLGIALVTTVFTLNFAATNTTGATSGPLFTGAYTLAYQFTIWTLAFLSVLGLIISVFRGLSPAEVESDAATAAADT
ncbi:MAG: MFS transporter [Candidatus Thorarchaeota archaeon]|jgi:EmrB/QacA subfamily drug resistance transporter